MNLKNIKQVKNKMSKSPKTKTKKQKYVKKDPIDHVLTRPDMYVGSTRPRLVEEFVVINEQYHIEKRKITISPGILRIFVEVLSNAVDNWARSKQSKTKCTEIRINIDEETGETSLWNNGNFIPIEMNDEEKCYNHTLIFGHLLTSENYDDNEDREDISGRNGLGVKCTNIFSGQFTVEGLDPINKKQFKQVWTHNMKTVGNPKVTNTKEKKGYTKVTYLPDFKQFSVEGYTPDILSLYKKYIVDISMITGIDVYYNDKLIPVKMLQDYGKLYNKEEKPSLIIKTSDCQVLLTEANEFEAISFANGVYTSLGGTHVEGWAEAIFRPLLKKLNKKGKPQLNIKDVKQFFRLFVIATVKKPEFDSQSKNKLESPKVEAEVKKTHIASICKWPVMERLEDMIRSKELLVLKKVERKGKYTKIESLDSANEEGGPKSFECNLILVEGLSAKTYVSYGIGHGIFGKEGRNWNGIYALRGKCLNTRNSAPASIAKNNVISDIIKAIGLKTGVDYTDDSNYKKLRYGRVVSVTDADVDGIHISGLLLNMFHSLFPTLLQREQAFFTSMQTPIVRVFLSKTNSKLFYDENEYRRYVTAFNKKYPNKKIDKKYYKGLGTNNPEDIDESFGKKLVEFRTDEHTLESMNKAFHKKYADARKDWLEKYDPAYSVLKWTGNNEEKTDLSLSEFINTELIKFSIDDCKRSIPSLMDGLKEGHRKVLYVTLLRNLKYTGKTLKVAQLAGSVAEKSGYHHGEQNLFGTITHMANSYVGSNNIPLLFADGQFGSRFELGKDAANGRYIFTKLEALTRLIFRPEDDVLLTHREDDGSKVEPYFYLPIIPMILVNGTICGIGTGWSSNVPCYNPIDLIASIKVWLDNDGKVLINNNNTVVSLLPELIPWYRGFTGTIESDHKDTTRFTSWGRVSLQGKKWVIDELPINVSTSKYKEQLETWKESKEIKDFKNYCDPKTETQVNFVIIESEDGLSCNRDTLKLGSSIRTSNMCLFTETEQLRKFNTVEEIIDAFCNVRYSYYIKRKKHQLDDLEYKIKFLGNKKRFLSLKKLML
jgi:DNA topoisomerase II